MASNSILATILFIAVSVPFLTKRTQEPRLHVYRTAVFAVALLVLSRLFSASSSEAFQTRGTGTAADATGTAIQINTLQKRAADLAKQIAKDNADLDALKRTATTSNAEIQKRRDEITKLTPQVNVAKTAYDNLAKRVETLRAEVNALMNASGGRQIKILTDRITANQKILTDIQAKLASLTAPSSV